MPSGRTTRRMLLGLAASAVLCASATFATAQDQTVTIGSFVATSGTGAPFGLDQLQAMELAVKHINASGGIGGRQLVLQHRDTAYDKTQAQSVMHEFIADPAVLGVIGPTSSAEAFAADPAANAAGLPVIAPANGAKGIPQIGAYVHRVGVPEEALLPAVARAAAEILKFKRVAILYAQDDPFALTGYQAFEGELKKGGVEVIEAVPYDAARTVDFAALLQRIAEAKPDAVFVAAKSTDAALLLRQARQSGLVEPIVGNMSFTSPALLAAAGDSVEGLVVGAVWDPTDPSEMNQRFVTEYKTQYNRDASPLSAGAYNAVYVVKEALEKSNDFSREGLQKGLNSMSSYHYLGAEISLVDVGGGLRDAALDVPILFQYQGGKLNKISK